MIYTVTLNPSLDYIVKTDRFQMGMINRTKGDMILAGGKGINVSAVLAGLDMPSIAFGFTGGFTGTEIERILDAKHVSHDFVHIQENSRINVKIEADKETQINGAGPDVSEGNMQELYQKLDLLKNGDVLVMSGSVPSSVPHHVYAEMMKRLQGKGILCAVDAEKDLQSETLPYRPFLIKPNIEELEMLFHKEIHTEGEIMLYARQLQDRGACNVLVSRGGDGACLLTEKGSAYSLPAPQGAPVNTVGAGDSMIAGFLYGYMKTQDYIYALKAGICAGSASAFSDQLASKKEILDLIDQAEETVWKK
jgi:1-phosphofructokinase